MSTTTKPPRTIAEAAGMIGVDARSLTTWLQKGCPGKHGGVYDIEAIRAWRDQNVRIKMPDHGQQSDQPTVGEQQMPSLNQSRAREAAARADLQEMKAAKLRGELISLHEAEMLIAIPMITIRKYMGDFPLWLVARLSFSCIEDQRKCQALAEKMIDDSMDAIRSAMDQIAHLATTRAGGKFTDEEKANVIAKAESEAAELVEMATNMPALSANGEATE